MDDRDQHQSKQDEQTELHPPLKHSPENEETANWRQQSSESTVVGPQEGVPGYEILKTLGRGGMGVVYKARDLRLKRLVALKMILSGGYADRESLARFHVEAETIARFTHPNIVQIYDVGEHAGRPYLTLELVDGGSLSQFAQGQTLSPRQAAEIVESLARAAGYAHAKGVVHRDLKPGNVLIDSPANAESSTRNGRDESEETVPAAQANASLTSGASITVSTHGPIPKITDFGLAKQLDGDSELTQSDAVLGTPSYMAPEQASGNVRAVGPAADIYSLGAILYWAVTNRAPFVGENFVQTISMVVNDDPVPPSRLQPRLPRDLETICLKCLEKQPTKRYQTADELADDLRRFLANEPILARAVSPVERTWKWIRRYPAVTAIILLLTVATPLLAWMWQTAESAGAALDTANQKLGRAVVRAETAEAVAVAQRDAARTRQAELTFDKGMELCNSGRPDRGLHWLLQSMEASAESSPDLERVARANLSAWSAHVHSVTTIFPHPYEMMAVAFTPDSQHLVTGTHDGVRQWNLATLQETERPVPGDIKVRGLAFSPDGKRLLVTFSNAIADPSAGGSSLWTLGDKPSELTLDIGPRVFAAAYSHDGKRIATGDDNFTARVWDTTTGRQIGEDLKTPFRDVRRVEFSVDDQRLLVVSNRHEGGSAQQWDLSGPQLVLSVWRTQTDHRVQTGGYSPDGRFGVTGATDGLLRFHDINQNREIRDALNHRVGIAGHQFTPDGGSIVTILNNGAMPIWNSATGERNGELFTHFGTDRMTISPDGRWLAVGALDGFTHLWRFAQPRSRPLRRSVANTSYATSATLLRPLTEFSADRRRVLIAGTARTGLAQWKDTATGQPVGPPMHHGGDTLRAIGISPNGDIAAVGGYQSEAGVNGFVTFWDLKARRILATVEHTNYVSALAFHPHKDLVAVGDYHKKVRFWNPRTGEELSELIVENDIIMSLAFREDGKQLAIGTANDWSKAPHIQIWDLETRKPVLPPFEHRGRVHTLQFSPDGKRLFAATDADPCLVWDAQTGKRLGAPIDTPQGFGAAEFSPDGETLYVGSGDGLVQCLRSEDTQPIAAPLRHPHAVRALAVHPNGNFLLVGCADGSAWLWDRRTHRQWGPPMVQSRGVIGVAFSEDGADCITVSVDSTVRRWPIPKPSSTPLHELRNAIERRTAMSLATDSLRHTTPEKWASQWSAKTSNLSLAEELGLGLPVEQWHEARARDAEQDGAPYAAAWHLDRLVAIKATAVRFSRRAEARWLLQRPEGALADLTKARSLASDEQIRAWHRHRAIELQRSRKFAAALWHLNQVVKDAPTDPYVFLLRSELRESRGDDPQQIMDDLAQAVEYGAGTPFIVRLIDHFSARGNWDRAYDYYEKATANGDLSLEDLCHGPLIQLNSQHESEYEAFAESLTATLSNDLATPTFLKLAEACVLGPGNVDTAKALSEAIQKKRNESPEASAERNALTRLLGAALVRADAPQDALPPLNEALDFEGENIVENWLFLALANQKLKRIEAARQWLSKAKQPSESWPSEFSWRHARWRLLLRECESAIGPQPAP